MYTVAKFPEFCYIIIMMKFSLLAEQGPLVENHNSSIIHVPGVRSLQTVSMIGAFLKWYYDYVALGPRPPKGGYSSDVHRRPF